MYFINKRKLWKHKTYFKRKEKKIVSKNKYLFLKKQSTDKKSKDSLKIKQYLQLEAIVKYVVNSNGLSTA